MIKIIFLALLLQQVRPDFILKKLRENTKIESIKFEATMEIKKGKRRLLKEFYGYGKGNNFLIVFTNPEDRDVKYLKLEKDLYIYLPDIDDVVRISGDMLKQSLMGSDLSYEDLMEDDPFSYYHAKIIKDTVLEGHKVYILELVDTTGNAPYYRVKLFVDKEKYISWKEELFTRSGRKIKETETLTVSRFGERYYITDFIMRDLRMRDSSTRITFKKLQFDIEIPESFFSKETLYK
ncbi:MAG: hypothetical protein DRQ02_13540 [Candidatus Latescibacterota bacterium]|nr:MAG: hypothetical protein DRQ02_13540 [Candidatus Latescibacterota bacterium]